MKVINTFKKSDFTVENFATSVTELKFKLSEVLGQIIQLLFSRAQDVGKNARPSWLQRSWWNVLWKAKGDIMPGDKPLQEYLSVHIFQELSVMALLRRYLKLNAKIEGDAWVPVQY